MKILFLCKRRPQGKDLFSRPYGRFFYLPYLLTQRGHHVDLLLLSYKRDPSLKIERNAIMWSSESIYDMGPLRYLKRVQDVAQSAKPDWIVGLSDTYYGILAQYYGRKYGIRSAIDAYDNYESYIPWFRPLHKCWRKAIKNADVVTAAGPQLSQYLSRFRSHKKVHIVPMAADPTGFRPLDKQECRKKLNLPQDRKLIGYCGSIDHTRGIEAVFSAYERVDHQNQNSLLVLSGRKQKKTHLPPNSRYLGYLSDDLMPILLNCMDVLLVPNELSKFGNFSHPVKLYEAMNCQIPVVATETAPVKWILNDKNQFLAHPGDVNDMAQKIIKAMELLPPYYEEQNTWENSCDILERVLLEAN